MTETMILSMPGAEQVRDRKGSESQLLKNEWHEFSSVGAYQCQIGINLVGSQFRATAIRLPNISVVGDSVADAVSSLKDAFTEAIDSYRFHGDAIPWGDEPRYSDFQIIKCFVIEFGPVLTNESIQDGLDEIKNGKTVDWEEVKRQVGL